jgi:hypothetical protein
MVTVTPAKVVGGWEASFAELIPLAKSFPMIEMMLFGATLVAASDAAFTIFKLCANVSEANVKKIATAGTFFIILRELAALC